MEGERIETQIANILAAGGPGVLTLGGITYKLGQPGDADMTAVAFEMMKVLRKKRQRQALEAVKAVASAGAEAIRTVMETVMGEQKEKPNETDTQALLHFGPSQFMEALQEPDGCAFLAWMLLTRHNPDLPLATVRTQITEDNVSGILLTMLKESRLGDLRPNSPGATGS